MRRRVILVIAVLCSVCAEFQAQAPSSSVKEVTAWPKGFVDLDGWRMKSGDDPAWAQPGFDDSSWKVVSLAAPLDPPIGFFWYRLHLRLPAGRPAMGLVVGLPENAYEIFVNGKRTGDARIGSPLTFYYATYHFVALPDGEQDFEIAVRQLSPRFFRSSPFSGAWAAPARVAQNYAEVVRLSDLAGKQYGVLPQVVLNLVVFCGGLAVWALFLAQHTKEYFWLSITLVLMGLLWLIYYASNGRLLPFSLQELLADPVTFLYLLSLIEFTFAFAHHRPSRKWRTFEAFLVLMTVFGWCSDVFGFLPVIYLGVQTAAVFFVSVALPILLLVWYRRGNREAGWLILPSFLILASAVADLSATANLLHLKRLGFLDSLTGFAIRSFRFETAAVMNFVYLVAIGIVLFFRYTRVTREQTRAAAELQAAHEIQSKLVTVDLPEIEGFLVKAAYVPAAEVGGDFFQVLRQENGSVLIAVGDVSGKGLRAAMTGTLAIGALRTLADEGMGPAQLLAALNHQVFRAGQGGFITLLCASLALDGTLTIANAGHLFPYRNGEEVTIETGMPLGIVEDGAYEETTLRLEPGDSITFLSDGVVEARRADGELFGFDRTAALSARSPEQIAQAAQEFGQEDDITVLSLAFVQAGT